MITREQFDEMLSNMKDYQKESVATEYCTNNGYETPIDMECLDEFYSKVTDFIPRWFYGHRYGTECEENNPNDNWFIYNGYGNIETMDAIAYQEWVDEQLEEIWSNGSVDEYFDEYFYLIDEDEEEDIDED